MVVSRCRRFFQGMFVPDNMLVITTRETVPTATQWMDARGLSKAFSAQTGPHCLALECHCSDSGFWQLCRVLATLPASAGGLFQDPCGDHPVQLRLFDFSAGVIVTAPQLS